MMPLVIDNGRGKLSTFIDLREPGGARDTRAACCATPIFSSRAIGPAPSRGSGFGPEEWRGCGPASSMCRSAPMATRDPGRTGAASTRWCRTPTASTHAEAEAAGSDAARNPCPAQALDHAAGYLMAFGAMTALARRATQGGSWHVRVSLAQTGHWLRGLGRGRWARPPGSELRCGRATGWRRATPASAA